MYEIAFQAILLCVGFLFSLSLLIKFKKGKDEEQRNVYNKNDILSEASKLNGGNIQ